MRCRSFLFPAFVIAICTPVFASDWPQFLGQNRDGITAETGLLKNWPDGGPKLKWKAKELGDTFSFSAPAVVKGRIYLLAGYKAGKTEHVFALDEKNGDKIWSTKIGTSGPNKSSGDYPGPRGTPTVVGDKLFALCSAGEIVCVDLAKGDVVWTKNLATDFNGVPGGWAYSESPLVDGDLVIVSPGGSKAGIVALNKNDGSLVWKTAVTGNPNAAYGSPIRVEVGGVKQYVCVLSKGLVGVSASDGKQLWQYNAIANNGIIIPTPMFHDNYIFGAAGYNKGGGVAKLTVDNEKVTATPGWFDGDLCAVQQIGGFLRVGDHLYGTAKGVGKSVELVCVDFKTGKTVWHNPGVGAAELCVADGMLYVRGEKDGTMLLVEPTPAGFKEHGRLKQPDRSKRPAWPYPVVANGCLYLRDMEVLLCYDVRDDKK